MQRLISRIYSFHYFAGDRASENLNGSCLSRHKWNGSAHSWRLFETRPKRHLAVSKWTSGRARGSLSDSLFLLQLGAKS